MAAVAAAAKVAGAAVAATAAAATAAAVAGRVPVRTFDSSGDTHNGSNSGELLFVGAEPLLVRVLGGNPVTSVHILACLNTADATTLRRLHPAIAAAVAGVPWADMDTRVVDAVRWRAALPAAVGAWLLPLYSEDLPPTLLRLTDGPALAALEGVTHLDLHNSTHTTDDVLRRLPTSLRTLNVSSCYSLTADASFAHLASLTSLECRFVGCDRPEALPPSLQELYLSFWRPPAGASLAHLARLRVLHATHSTLDAATFASLPPGVVELRVADCDKMTAPPLFAHLSALRIADVSCSTINDASLASMPPSPVFLDVSGCRELTPAAVLPALPALRVLDVSGTNTGDALVASAPSGLTELRVTLCSGVTAGATLDHLPALRVLQCSDGQLAPAVLAACRARGCAVTTVSQLPGEYSLSTLSADGQRLWFRDASGRLQARDMRTGSESTVLQHFSIQAFALVGFPDGHRLAFGVRNGDYPYGDDECAEVQVWKVGGRRITTIPFDNIMRALVALSNSRLAAGDDDGSVRILDVGTSAVTVVLEGHRTSISKLVALPGSRLASASADGTLRLWDVGARTCVGVLTGHTEYVCCLTVLADGRLASGSDDGTVRLWDVGARACVGVLTVAGLGEGVSNLAALPDGRLAVGCGNGNLRLLDTRPAAAAAAAARGRAAGALHMVMLGRMTDTNGTLLALPAGRIVSAAVARDDRYLWELPPPAALE